MHYKENIVENVCTLRICWCQTSQSLRFLCRGHLGGVIEDFVSNFADANMLCSAGEECLGTLSVVGGAAAGNRLQCAHAGSAAERSSWPRRHVLAVSQGSKLLTPDEPAKCTIAFGTGGSVSARIDCNRGRGTWNSSEPNQLQFG